ACLPRTQPPQLHAMIMVATAVATQDQKTSVFVGRALLHRCPRLNCSLFWSIPRLLLHDAVLAHDAVLVDARRGTPGCVWLCRHRLTALPPSSRWGAIAGDGSDETRTPPSPGGGRRGGRAAVPVVLSQDGPVPR